MVSATFSGTTFFRSDPHVVGNGDLVGLWPDLGLGHLEKFRAKNRKIQFPGARALLEKKFVRPKHLSPTLRNVFTFCNLVDRTRTGGKSQNTSFLGPLWLGQPLALREIISRKTDCREYTGTCPNSDVTPSQVQLVLRWATTWKHQVKIVQNQFLWPKSTKTSFFNQN